MKRFKFTDENVEKLLPLSSNVQFEFLNKLLKFHKGQVWKRDLF